MHDSHITRDLFSRGRRPAPTVPSQGDIAQKSRGYHSAASPFAWPANFYERHDIAFVWENTAWALNKTLTHELVSPRDIICYILRTDEDSARYEGRIRPILDICYGVQLEKLLTGNLPGPCRKMGWIIDGCYREEQKNPWTSRPCLGALSARQMAKTLLEKRYITFLADNELDDPQAIDAERRLIYITSLDSWSILALIMTSPESHARLLAGFLQRHLCARPSIGVSIASDGPSIFALDFHVPFRVWRTSDQLLLDPRVKASTGKPLRNSRNMNFLVTPNDNITPKVHGIYSAHVAFLVTGYDQWRWTAILAIDTWFNTGECITDKVERYQFDLEDGMLLDPLSGGQDDANKPIWEPRAYFLRIVLLRIVQIADEWELLRSNLEEGVDNMVDRQKLLFLRLRPFSTGSDPDEYGREFEGFEAHLRDLKEILQELLQDLYETLKVGEGFLSTEVNFFLNDEGSPGDATECYPSLSEIRRNFNELAQLYAVFISLKERSDHMTQNCDEARRKYFYQGVSIPNHDLIVHDPVISEKLSDILSHQKVLVQTRLDLANLASEMKESRIENIRKAQEHDQIIRELRAETTHYYDHSRKFQVESICFAKKDQENMRELQAELRRVSEESRKNILEVRVLAWHTLVLASPFLASALFSAEGAMPFKQSPVSFIITVVSTYVVMTALHRAITWLVSRASQVVPSSDQVASASPLSGYEDETCRTKCLDIVPCNPTDIGELIDSAKAEEHHATTTAFAGISKDQQLVPAETGSRSSGGTEVNSGNSWCKCFKRQISWGIRRRSRQMNLTDVELGLVVPPTAAIPAS